MRWIWPALHDTLVITPYSKAGTRYVRHARGWHTSSIHTVVRLWGKLPCASGTYDTQEAGTRSPYVQYGGG